jgi:hypothetical protein
MTTRHWILTSALFAAGYAVMAPTAVVAQGCFPCSSDQQCEEDCCAPGTIADCSPQNRCKCIIPPDEPPPPACPAIPGCTFVTCASDSFPQMGKYNPSIPWSKTCSDGSSGALENSWASDDQRQCREEVFEENLGPGPQPCPASGGYTLEHWWKFTNVPAGNQHLHFEGTTSAVPVPPIPFGTCRDAGTSCFQDADCPPGDICMLEGFLDPPPPENFIFYHNTAPGHLNPRIGTSPGEVCDPNECIGGSAAEEPGGRTTIAPFKTTTGASTIYILVQGHQIDSCDQQVNRIHLDHLAICTKQ